MIQIDKTSYSTSLDATVIIADDGFVTSIHCSLLDVRELIDTPVNE